MGYEVSMRNEIYEGGRLVAVTDDGNPELAPDPTPDPTPDLAAEVANLTARVDGFAGLAVTLATLSGVPEAQAQAIVADAVGGPTP